MNQPPSGPLAGLRVVEFAGIAPAPFAALMLADLGADVLRIDRATGDGPSARPAPAPARTQILGRGRRSVAIDLKTGGGAALAHAAVTRADVLIEGNRPGVMERLGLGPDAFSESNPGLVYGRLTGWGQDGPYAHKAGHDLNYIAVSGALGLIGRDPERPPAIPVNLLGDFAAGGMLLVIGILAALADRARSGRGQVVDAAMVDGAALLTTFIHGLHTDGHWSGPRGTNLLDGGAPFYDTYPTADGRLLAVAAVEPRFYTELVRRLDLDLDPADQHDRSTWPRTRDAFARRIASRTRAEWEDVLADADVCVSPVLSLDEAAHDPHLASRGVMIDVAGVTQPAPAPRFSRTPAGRPAAPPPLGAHGPDALLDWGVPPALVRRATSDGAVAVPATTPANLTEESDE
ncbi:CaiB/BaiF CoA transferase family protein [Actinomadura roseirufa]|uniref:CaiB/BaiF CoA transferase family protein n=1 Tax=Actinomadura roseirufa TaxID=2094049 RepID=UPI001A9560A3|nr:CaiB/BaiF CoA-transferase family protein [Actinomadura roseirufa]